MSQSDRLEFGKGGQPAMGSSSTQNKPIRLMHVFPSFEVGGSQVRFAKLAKALGNDYHHLIVSLNDRWDALDALLQGVPTCEAVDTGLPKAFGARDYPKIRRLLKDRQVDILVTYNWGAVDFALANRFRPVCPHVDMEDGFGPDEASARLLRRNLARRLAYSGAKALIAPSRVLEKIAREEWKVAEDIVRFLPNGIDCRRFDNGPDVALLAQLGLDNCPGPVVGTIATLRPEKNLYRLIDAFNILREKHPDCRLVIAGDGGERQSLELAARQSAHADAILFTGRIDEPERIVGAFDVFALSSDTEQMPFSVLEAMAAGKPIASVDVGDVKNMLAADNARYICDKSAEALAETLSALLADQALSAALGAANAAHVRAVYDLRDMVASYDKLFRNIVKS